MGLVGAINIFTILLYTPKCTLLTTRACTDLLFRLFFPQKVVSVEFNYDIS